MIHNEYGILFNKSTKLETKLLLKLTLKLEFSLSNKPRLGLCYNIFQEKNI